MAGLGVRHLLLGIALGMIGACADHGAPPAFTPDDLTQCEAPTPCPQLGAFPAGP